MKEIRTIINQYNRLKDSGKKMALATVVYVEGSSYRREGARMLVVEDGTWVGGISGGCLEGDALRKAKNAIIRGTSSIVRYDTREEDAFQIGVGLGCNGVIDVLITPLSQKLNPLAVLEKNMTSRHANILITFIGSHGPYLEGSMIEYNGLDSLQDIDNLLVTDHLLKEIEAVKTQSKSKIIDQKIEDTALKVFIEYLPPEMRLILFGSNYDIYPLVDIATNIGWDITAVCNPQKLDKSLFNKASIISNKTSEDLELDNHTAAVLMAHDYKTDMNNLKKLINTKIGYIGMLGPKVRSEKIFDELKSEGIVLSDDDLDKIHAPIGLDTGAMSPEEIAISIVAEIRAYFSKRTGGFLRERSSTIHERNLK